ncbi:MAG: GDSL-type esterase/lipase family protein [Acidobacteriota bacterium]
MKILAAITRTLGLIAGGSLAGLVLAEIVVRVFLPQPLLHDPDAFVEDPVLGARLKPGFSDRVTSTEFSSTWTINSGGYRGPLAGERGAPSFRIVALGDSFTFGYGVEEEESWPRRLESILNGRRDASRWIEVVNLGVGGYGTWNEIRFLERERDLLHPDLVLLAFYVGNDPDDNVREEAREAPEGPAIGSVRAARPPRSERLKRWMGTHSQLYNLVATRGDEILVRTGLRKLVYPLEVDILRSPEPASVSAGWKATRAAFAALRRLAEGDDLRIVPVLIPMKHQVSDEFWKRLTARYGSLSGDGAGRSFERDRPQRILEGILREEGFEPLDLVGDLRAAAGRGRGALYWARDQHWNVRGHEVAARAIAAYLERQGLLPRRSSVAVSR